MFRIAVCDDDQMICNELKTIITDYAKENNPDIRLDVYPSAVALKANILEGRSYEMIFLDIQMESVTGIEFGKWLRDSVEDEKTKIIFISYTVDYALELFRIRPTDFLQKPVKKEDVIYNIEKCMELLGDQSRLFMYKFNNENRMVPIDTILYFESANRTIIAHTTKGDIMFYEKLEDVMARMDSRYFWRIHKSYLINRIHVERFTNKKVIMKNGKELSISNPYRQMVKAMQMKEMGKE